MARESTGPVFYVRALLVLAWFMLSSVIGIAMVAIRPRDPSNGRRFSRLCSALALPLFGVRVCVHHGDRLRTAQPCVFVANHQANEDVFVHGSFYPPRTVVTGKRELLRIPFFGWMFAAMGNILLDRGHHEQALKQLGAAAERIRRDGISVWIFPEGHRNGGHQLLPFKRGGFHLAVLAQVPIVPVATQRYGDMIDIKGRRLTAGTIHVEILEPIPTAGLTDADVPELTARVQAAIEQALPRLASLHKDAERQEMARASGR